MHDMNLPTYVLTWTSLLLLPPHTHMLCINARMGACVQFDQLTDYGKLLSEGGEIGREQFQLIVKRQVFCV